VDAAADRALERPEPEPDRARRWLLAGDPPHGYLAEVERTRETEIARGRQAGGPDA
jgi:hypothetical protein